MSVELEAWSLKCVFLFFLSLLNSTPCPLKGVLLLNARPFYTAQDSNHSRLLTFNLIKFYRPAFQIHFPFLWLGQP
jgi:hypothetical protein